MCAGLAGFVGVGVGAFGAHSLRGRLTPEMLAVFETGVRYHMYHVFALGLAAWGFHRFGTRHFTAAAVLFGAGIIVFSGSLYLLALSGERWLGAVTPLGGLAFLAGWLCLALGAAAKIRA